MASLKVYVKGDPATNTLLDCPFCHRVLLTLETKHVPYEKEYIDVNNKPSWLQERSGGKVPVINDGDFWLPDSDKIVEWLEQQHPNPSMASSVPADVTGSFFGAFRGLLMASAEEAADKKAAFLGELAKVEGYLAAHGPFFGGEQLDATDAAMAPKMYHALTALGHFKGLALDPSKFPAVSKYRELMKEQPAWKATDYGQEAVVKGWAAHMAQ
ncbi:dehydroascorbate reductase [Scenedesmus sp. NREL 46B-D3]|nr:dehydroascorbate reductase [Scenedesmus sp. NREL 46B-D3]